MNSAQKKNMVGVIIAIIIAFLFPPHAFFMTSGAARMMDYAFIANIPERHSVHVAMLLVEIFIIAIIGGIVYFLLKEK